MLLIYAIDSGRVEQIINAPAAEAAHYAAAGRDVLAVDQYEGGYVVDGAVVPFSAAPTPLHEWSWQSHAWELEPIEAVRLATVKRLKAERDRRIAAGFAWDGAVFDSDADSQARLLGLFVSAQSAPAAFPVRWRLADNSWRELAAADAVAVFAQLQAHLKGLFDRFGALESAVLTMDHEALQAFDALAAWDAPP
jgi:hypothetical protein